MKISCLLLTLLTTISFASASQTDYLMYPDSEVTIHVDTNSAGDIYAYCMHGNIITNVIKNNNHETNKRFPYIISASVFSIKQSKHRTADQSIVRALKEAIATYEREHTTTTANTDCANENS